MSAAVQQTFARKGFLDLLKEKGFRGDIDALMKQVLADEDLCKLPANKLESAIVSAAAEAAKKAEAAFQKTHGVNVRAIRPNVLVFDTIEMDSIKNFATMVGETVSHDTGLKARTAQRFADETANRAAGHTPHKNFADRFKLDEMNVNKGIGLLVAGMATFGAFDLARHVLSEDAQGQTKVNITPLAWTLGQAALAIGSVYLAMRAPQLAARA